MNAAINDNNAKAKCAVCRKPALAAYRPFCSKRCADVDLNRWLTTGYRVHTDEEPDPGEPIPIDLDNSH